MHVDPHAGQTLDAGRITFTAWTDGRERPITIHMPIGNDGSMHHMHMTVETARSWAARLEEACDSLKVRCAGARVEG